MRGSPASAAESHWAAEPERCHRGRTSAVLAPPHEERGGRLRHGRDTHARSQEQRQGGSLAISQGSSRLQPLLSTIRSLLGDLGSQWELPPGDTTVAGTAHPGLRLSICPTDKDGHFCTTRGDRL